MIVWYRYFHCSRQWNHCLESFVIWKEKKLILLLFLCSGKDLRETTISKTHSKKQIKTNIECFHSRPLPSNKENLFWIGTTDWTSWSFTVLFGNMYQIFPLQTKTHFTFANEVRVIPTKYSSHFFKTFLLWVLEIYVSRITKFGISHTSDPIHNIWSPSFILTHLPLSN